MNRSLFVPPSLICPTQRGHGACARFHYFSNQYRAIVINASRLAIPEFLRRVVCVRAREIMRAKPVRGMEAEAEV